MFQIRSSESQRQQDKRTENHSIEIWHTLITVHWYKQQRNASWNNWINKSINRAGRHPRWRHCLRSTAPARPKQHCADLRHALLESSASPHHRITARPSFPQPPFPHKLRRLHSALRSPLSAADTQRAKLAASHWDSQPASYLAIQPAIQPASSQLRKRGPMKRALAVQLLSCSVA